MRGVTVFAALAIGAFAAVGLGAASGIRFNHTESAPRGLWRVTSPAGPLERDTFVALCLPTQIAGPAYEHGYIGKGTCNDGYEPLIKYVGAVAGDQVTITAADVLVNGRRVAPAPLSTDSLGRPLQRMQTGVYTVETGTVWLIGDHSPRSWDSRYYGPVPVGQIYGRASPLVIVD